MIEPLQSADFVQMFSVSDIIS